MRIAAFFMPLLALLSGAAGFYIRRLELRYVFDPITGLPERGATLTYLLFGLTALVLLFILIFSIVVSVKRKTLRGFEDTFGTDHLAYPFIYGLIGAVWSAATVLHFLHLRELGQIPLIDILFLAMSALAAISVSFFAIEMFQDPRRKSVFALSVIPTIFTCFWLVILYRENASNPILLSYAYMCLAIITSALGFYFTSGFVYGKPAPGKTIFFYFTAVFFCAITLADHHQMTIRVIFAAILIMNVVYLSMLIRNLQRKEL
ncbi:MAG: hypothetical protein FWC66_06555 [Oscillospiraceae bacterium]|nr:hypothetical protein [Oscillospiraceae bacterium]